MAHAHVKNQGQRSVRVEANVDMTDFITCPNNTVGKNLYKPLKLWF